MHYINKACLATDHDFFRRVVRDLDEEFLGELFGRVWQVLDYNFQYEQEQQFESIPVH